MRPTSEDRHSAGNTSLGENPCSGLDEDDTPMRTYNKILVNYMHTKLIIDYHKDGKDKDEYAAVLRW